ncbi:MAG: peptidoglycan DD-metalloendopeptidase family protein, partial [Actinobacteria bacterium]|nr:peptidoglycan DD-metalloendopeptidase family protein [Actinomycetota bacterium]
RLTEATSRGGSSTLASFVATLDAVGNPTQIVRTGALQETQEFTYDSNDRIASVCFQAGTCPGATDPFVRWAYDGVGNRLTEQRGDAGTTTYAYDAADRLTRAGSITYTYDENGNQLSAGSRTFTYDLANRLRTTRQGSTTTTYSYDGDGVRIQTSTGSSSSKTTNFLWDVNHALPQIALERNGSGSTLREYAYGANRISMTSGSKTNFFHYDGLGSVVNMTSSSGSRRWTWSYEPFGVIRTEQRSGGGAPTNFMKFTGQYLDPTDLYHLRARQYDPASGRFLRPDPVDAAVGTPLISAYVYAANRPTVMVDPSGETFRPASHGPEVALFIGSRVDVDAPLLCISRSCGGQRPSTPARKLVHPIPLGYPASSGPVHPTGGIEHYRALDFFPGAGAPVLAVQSGIVYRFSGNDPRRGEVDLGIYGWSLYLKADSGSDYFYTHLGSRTVGLGRRVRAGQVIGKVGRWVRPSGENKSHLHLGVYGGPITIGMVRRAPRVRA